MPSLAPSMSCGITGRPGQCLVVAAETTLRTLGSIGVYGVLVAAFTGGHFYLRISQNLVECAFYVGHIIDWEYPAVHGGCGELRQGVLGMASGEQRWNAGGAQGRVVMG